MSSSEEAQQESAGGGRIICEIRLPSENHKLYCWKVRSGSFVSAGETVALARQIDGDSASAGDDNKSTNQEGGDGAAVSPVVAAPQKHKRPTRRRRLGGAPPPAAAAATTDAATGAAKLPAPGADVPGEEKKESATADDGVKVAAEVSTTTAKPRTKNSNLVSIMAQGDGIVHLGPRPTTSNGMQTEAAADAAADALVIGYIDQCRHGTIVDGMCAVCGTRARDEQQKAATHHGDSSSGALKPPPPNMTHVTVGGLTVVISETEGQRMAQQDAERLRQQRKLSLVLDLDHTLVHATNDVRARQHLGRDDVRSLVLPLLFFDPQKQAQQQQQSSAAAAPQQQHMWMQHFVKLRPYVKEFLETALELFEVGVYTAGTRDYAEQITIMLARHLVGATCDQVDLDGLRHRLFLAEAELQRAKVKNKKGGAEKAQDPSATQDQKKAKVETSGERPNAEGSGQDKDSTKATVATASESAENASNPETSETDKSAAAAEVTPSAREAGSREGETNGETEATKADANDCNTTDMTATNGEKAEKTKSLAGKKRKKVTFGEGASTQKTDQITEEQVAELRSKLRQAEELESRALEMRQRLFGSRVVSRTDVGDLGRDVKSLKRIFPCGGTMAVVVDDREDVWANAVDNDVTTTTRKGEPPENLLLVRPYHWRPFLGFADVNNPAGADLSKTGSSSSSSSSNSKSAEATDANMKEADEQLLWTTDILKRLHQRFYAQEEGGVVAESSPNGGNKVTVAEILGQMRRQVLSGGSVILSGLVPLHKQNLAPNVPRPPVIRYVENLGATVLPNVTPFVTHVVGAKDGTDKILNARRVPGCFIVKASWLMECVWSLTRRDEQKHLLGAPPASVRSSGKQPSQLGGSQGGAENANQVGVEEDDDDDDDEELAAEFEKEFM